MLLKNWNRNLALPNNLPARHGRRLSKIFSALYFFCINSCIVLLTICNGCKNESGSSFEKKRPASNIPEKVYSDISQLTSDDQKAAYLLNLCEEWSEQDPKLTLELANLAIDFSQNKEFDSNYAKSLYWSAFVTNQENPQSINLEKALIDVKISIAILEKKKMPIWLSRALNLRALIHYNLYEEETGAIYNLKAQRVMKDVETSNEQVAKTWGDIYRTAGNIELYTTKNIETVLDYFHRSYSYYTEIADTNRLARLMVNFAIVYDKSQKLEFADSCYLVAINLYQQKGNPNNIAKTYLEYATYHANRFMDSKDKRWFQSSNQWLKASLELSPSNLAEIYYQLGANFQNLSLYTDTSADVLLDSAVYFYKNVLNLGVKEKNTRYIEIVAEEIAGVCPDINADVCSTLLAKVGESYQAIVDSTNLALSVASYKMEQFKDRQAAGKMRQLILWSSLAVLGIGILFLVLYLKSRVTFFREQLSTQLKALRAQMNPHFISNSLNAIDSLIHQNRKEEASEYIIDFSRLCRLILNNSKKMLISLDNELETLKYYLSLEKLRMGEKLNYSFNIDEELNTSEIQIPPMLLQPFVENAIIHGIQKKQTPGHIMISINRNKGGLLECIVEDDGVGRKRAKEMQKQSLVDRPSFGIAITQERIDTLKKIKGSYFEIIDLYDADGKASGTRVNIKIPIINRNHKNII
ncbi:MAG: histidine kinase [Bacteroidota bacterium]